MSSRIRAVQVALHLPDAHAHEQGAVRDEIERGLVVTVMERVEARLHAALGRDAIVCLRHLALRWTLGRDELRHDEVLDRLADELVGEVLTAVAALTPAERRRPSGAGVAVFTSAAHQRAVALADLADGHEPRWYHGEPLDGPARWREVAASAPADAIEVVTILDALARLEPALALAEDATLATIAALAPAARPGAARLAARRAMATPTTRAAAGAPTVGADLDAIATADADHAAATSAPVVTAPIATTDQATGEPTASAPTSPATRDDATAEAEPSPPPDAVTTANQDRSATDAATLDDATDAPAPPAPPAADGPRLDAEVLTAETAWAGLFYLLRAALEIDAAEALWTAGLPEGAVLAEVARAILAVDDDPAWRWFGGCFDRPPPALAVAAWQLDEIRATTSHALGRHLVHHARVTTPEALASELAALGADLAVPHGPGPTAALLRHLAAVLAGAACGRLRVPASWSMLRAIAARPGRLIATRDRLTVVMAASAVDLDHRRAGLDHDPGYVPWLRRQVGFEFAGGEAW